ncbi:MAG: hypothetical protein EOP86_05705 [Verrucomicrobiaceae bacterium]|nr:MAG: hypothetical protein EOP86_05705 [Verrucomicrobiaceae bacterium]
MTLKPILFAALALAGASLQEAKAQLLFTIGTAGTTASTNNWPAGEAPAFGVDGTPGTKYLNFAKLNTGLVFTPSTAGTVVTGINFTTANDAVDRDPASYILFGSNSAVVSDVAGSTLDVSASFTEISAGTLALPAERLTVGGAVTFANTTAYNTYLLVFPTVKNEVGANSMQIGDAILQASGGIGGAGTPVGGGVLTAVPETGSAALLGLTGLGLLARRRRN